MYQWHDVQKRSALVKYITLLFFNTFNNILAVSVKRDRMLLPSVPIIVPIVVIAALQKEIMTMSALI